MSRNAALAYISNVNTGEPRVVRKKEDSQFIVRKTKRSTDPLRGKVCPACGMERSVAGRCECNE